MGSRRSESRLRKVNATTGLRCPSTGGGYRVPSRTQITFATPSLGRSSSRSAYGPRAHQEGGSEVNRNECMVLEGLGGNPPIDRPPDVLPSHHRVPRLPSATCRQDARRVNLARTSRKGMVACKSGRRSAGRPGDHSSNGGEYTPPRKAIPSIGVPGPRTERPLDVTRLTRSSLPPLPTNPNSASRIARGDVARPIGTHRCPLRKVLSPSSESPLRYPRFRDRSLAPVFLLKAFTNDLSLLPGPDPPRTTTSRFHGDGRSRSRTRRFWTAGRTRASNRISWSASRTE